jgi:threonine aldolase
MRQVGILAAAGIISLEKMTARLKDDHARARRLADGLRKLKGVLVDSDSPYTNMVYLNLVESILLDGMQISTAIKKLGILVDIENPRRFRLVTHYWVDDKAVDTAIKAFAEVLS